MVSSVPFCVFRLGGRPPRATLLPALAIGFFVAAGARAAEPELLCPGETPAGGTIKARIAGAPSGAEIHWAWDKEVLAIERQVGLEAEFCGLQKGTGFIAARIAATGWSARQTVTITRAVDEGRRPPPIERPPAAAADPAQVAAARELLDRFRQGQVDVTGFFRGMKARGLSIRDMVACKANVIEQERLRLIAQGVDGQEAIRRSEEFWVKEYARSEQDLMAARQQGVTEAIHRALARYVQNHPDTPYLGAKMDVGGWASEPKSAMRFEGDIDFSLIMVDIEDAIELRDLFDQEIRRAYDLNMIEIDALATAHRAATSDVYIGDYGAKWAEIDAIRRGKMYKLKVVDGKIVPLEMTADEKMVMLAVLENNEYRRRTGKDILDTLLLEGDPKPRADMEPGVSLEFLRHVQHDVLHAQLSLTEQIIKTAKYVNRSATDHGAFLAGVEGFQLTPKDTALAQAVRNITDVKQDKAMSAEAKLKRTMNIVTALLGEGWAEDPHAALQELGRRAVALLTHNIEEGVKARLLLIERIQDPAEAEAERRRLLGDLENEFKAFQESHAAFPESVRAAMLDLAEQLKRSGHAVTVEEAERIREFIEKVAAENPDCARLALGAIYQRGLALYGSTDAAIDFLNDRLDRLDNATIQKLRTSQVIGVDLGGGYKFSIGSVNQALNDSVLGKVGNNAVFKGFNLAQEGAAYYHAITSGATWQDSGRNLATEIFRRRVPLGSVVDAFYQENYLRVGVEMVYAIFPVLAVPEGLYGMAAVAAEWGMGVIEGWDYEDMVEALYQGAVFEKAGVGQGWRLVRVTYRAPGEHSTEVTLSRGEMHLLPDRVPYVWQRLVPQFRTHGVLQQYEAMLGSPALSQGPLKSAGWPYAYLYLNEPTGTHLHRQYLAKADQLAREYFIELVRQLERRKAWETGTGYADVLAIERALRCSGPLAPRTGDPAADQARFAQILADWGQIRKANRVIEDLQKRWGADFLTIWQPSCCAESIAELAKETRPRLAQLEAAERTAREEVRGVVGEGGCTDDNLQPVTVARLAMASYPNGSYEYQVWYDRHEQALDALRGRGTPIQIQLAAPAKAYVGRPVRLSAQFDRDVTAAIVSWEFVPPEDGAFTEASRTQATWTPAVTGKVRVRVRVRQHPDEPEPRHVTRTAEVEVLPADAAPRAQVALQATIRELAEDQFVEVRAEPVSLGPEMRPLIRYFWAEDGRSTLASEQPVYRFQGRGKGGSTVRVAVVARDSGGELTPEASIELKVTAGASPGLTVAIEGARQTVAENQTLPLQASTAVKDDSGQLTLQWSLNGEPAAFGPQWIFDPKPWAGKTVQIDLFAQDEQGRDGQASCQVEVQAVGGIEVRLGDHLRVVPVDEPVTVAVFEPREDAGTWSYAWTVCENERWRDGIRHDARSFTFAPGPLVGTGGTVRVKVTVRDPQGHTGEAVSDLIRVVAAREKLQVRLLPERTVIGPKGSVLLETRVDAFPDSGRLKFFWDESAEPSESAELSIRGEDMVAVGQTGVWVPTVVRVVDDAGRTGEAGAAVKCDPAQNPDSGATDPSGSEPPEKLDLTGVTLTTQGPHRAARGQSVQVQAVLQGLDLARHRVWLAWYDSASEKLLGKGLSCRVPADREGTRNITLKLERTAPAGKAEVLLAAQHALTVGNGPDVQVSIDGPELVMLGQNVGLSARLQAPGIPWSRLRMAWSHGLGHEYGANFRPATTGRMEVALELFERIDDAEVKIGGAVHRLIVVDPRLVLPARICEGMPFEVSMIPDVNVADRIQNYNWYGGAVFHPETKDWRTNRPVNQPTVSMLYPIRSFAPNPPEPYVSRVGVALRDAENKAMYEAAGQLSVERMGLSGKADSRWQGGAAGDRFGLERRAEKSAPQTFDDGQSRSTASAYGRVDLSFGYARQDVRDEASLLQYVREQAAEKKREVVPIRIEPFRGYLARDRAVVYKGGSGHPLSGYRDAGAMRAAQGWLISGPTLIEISFFGSGGGSWDNRDQGWLMARTEAIFQEAAAIVSGLRFEPAGKFQVSSAGSAAPIPEPAAPPLAVQLAGPEKPVRLGTEVEMVARVTGGQAPYRYEWQGEYVGRGERVSVPTCRPGEQRLEVRVTSADQQSASAWCTYRVDGAMGYVMGIPPRVAYGGRYAIAAQVPPALATHRILWHASPGVEFEDPESPPSGTHVRIDRCPDDGLRLWGQIVNEIGATVGELEQITVQVVPPVCSLSFDPPSGRVGQLVVARVTTTPAVEDALIDFRWLEPESSLREARADNGSVISVVPRTTEPLALHALVRVPGTGDELGEVRGQYRPSRYVVRARMVPSGPPVQVWVPGEGLRDVPPGSYVTGQRIFVAAEIADYGDTASVRWNWTANSGTLLSNPESSSPTVSRSEPGLASLGVVATDAAGIQLGTASLAFAIVDPAAGLPGEARIAANGGEPTAPTDSPGDSGAAANGAGSPPETSPLPPARQARLLAAAAVAHAARGDFAQAAATVEQGKAFDAALAEQTAAQVVEAAKQAAQQFEEQSQYGRAAEIYVLARHLAPEDELLVSAEQQCRRRGQVAERFTAGIGQLEQALGRRDLDLARELIAELDGLQEHLPAQAREPLEPLRESCKQQQAAYDQAISAFRAEIQKLQQESPGSVREKLLARAAAGDLRHADYVWIQTQLRGMETAGAPILPRVQPMPQANAEISRIVQRWNLQRPDGQVALTLLQQADRVSGWLESAGQREPLQDLRYDPATSRIQFKQASRSLEFSGLVNGSRIEGQVRTAGRPPERWTATRESLEATDREGNAVGELALRRPPILLTPAGEPLPASGSPSDVTAGNSGSHPGNDSGSASPLPPLSEPGAEPAAPANRGYFGVTIHNPADPAARALGITAANGAAVTAVWPQSPAELCGLDAGDVIVGCNGMVIQSAADLQTAMQQGKPGDRFSLDVHRGRRAMRLEVTLGQWPSQYTPPPSATAPAPPVAPPSRSAYGRHTRPPLVGIWTVSAGSREAHALGVETPLGAVVTQVQANSPAARAGLRVADVVVAFGNREIGNCEDLEIALLSCPTDSRQTVTVVRGHARHTLALTIGVGPADRQTYADYRHPSGGYTLRLPVSWKVTRSSTQPDVNVNAHDLVASRDGNYRLLCYLVTKRVSNPDQALSDFQQVCRRDLGKDAQIARFHGLAVPLAFAAVPYQTDRRVMLYRIALVKNDTFYLIDALAPVLSDPATLTDVLRTILETV